jgi:LAS superfamily LD-carboxypeptidase LdcB
MKIFSSAQSRIIIPALIGLVFLGYYAFKLRGELDLLEHNLAVTSDELAVKTSENEALNEALFSERQKNSYFEAQIKDIAGTVGVLDKLAKTDQELLQKYSKVYFLNEHYAPKQLTLIPEEFTLPSDSKKYQFHSEAAPFLLNMLNDAKKAGVELQVISAYRSYAEQVSLKGSYQVTYGSGANTFSADQGYSEHQLGTAVDFTTPKLGTGFAQFSTSDAYQWLLNNAYRYGLIISYPENNAYYQFEPWHWRFVGKKLAERLNESKEYFYDLSQRNINAYLINIFD